MDMSTLANGQKTYQKVKCKCGQHYLMYSYVADLVAAVHPDVRECVQRWQCTTVVAGIWTICFKILQYQERRCECLRFCTSALIVIRYLLIFSLRMYIRM